MTSQSVIQGLRDIGFLLLAGVVPILFLSWYWPERTLTTKQWAILSGVIFVSGLLTRVVAIAIIAGLVLLAIGIAWLWHRVILADLEYRRAFLRTHIFPGEETNVTWTITNNKPLPISWLRWQEPIPIHPTGFRGDVGIQIDGPTLRSIKATDTVGLDEVTALKGYETLERTCAVHALRRGYYRFGPVTWEASDALGLFTATSSASDNSSLTVYPVIRNFSPLEIDIRALLGDVRRRHALLEDPTWYRGDRDYHNDPMRMIDWKATARGSGLQVRMFEPTVHPKLMILTNLHAFENISQGWIPEYMEDVISIAASIAHWALQSGFEVGIHSNGALPDAYVPYRIPPSSAVGQLFTILDYLAKITLTIHRRVEDMLTDLDDLAHGTSVLICTNVVTQGLMNTLLTSRRHDISLVLVNNNVDFTIPGVKVIHVETATQAA